MCQSLSKSGQVPLTIGALWHLVMKHPPTSKCISTAAVGPQGKLGLIFHRDTSQESFLLFQLCFSPIHSHRLSLFCIIHFHIYFIFLGKWPPVSCAQYLNKHIGSRRRLQPLMVTVVSVCDVHIGLERRGQTACVRSRLRLVKLCVSLTYQKEMLWDVSSFVKSVTQEDQQLVEWSLRQPARTPEGDSECDELSHLRFHKWGIMCELAGDQFHPLLNGFFLGSRYTSPSSFHNLLGRSHKDICMELLLTKVTI